MTVFRTVTGADFRRSMDWAKKAPRLRDQIMTAAEKLINDVPLEPVPTSVETSDLPHVTHKGVLRFCGHELRVYQLSSGQRVFAAEDVKKLFEPHP